MVHFVFSEFASRWLLTLLRDLTPRSNVTEPDCILSPLPNPSAPIWNRRLYPCLACQYNFLQFLSYLSWNLKTVHTKWSKINTKMKAIWLWKWVLFPFSSEICFCLVSRVNITILKLPWTPPIEPELSQIEHFQEELKFTLFWGEIIWGV